MPDPRTQPPGGSPDLAVAVHLEPLAEGARVLWVGVDPEAPAQWSGLAASVRALLPEDVALPEPDRSRPLYAHLRPGGPAFRPDSFDVVVVPDLGAVGLDDAEGVERLRRGLRADGTLVVGLAVEEDPDDVWDRLVDLADAERDDVRLFGQATIVAATFAELDGEEPLDGVVFDGSLAGDEPDGDGAERFLAVVGERAARLDGLLVVRVPGLAPVVDVVRERVDEGWDEDGDDDEGDELDAATSAEIEALTEHAEALEHALDEARAEAARAHEALDRAVAERDRARDEADGARADLARLRDAAGADGDADADVDEGHARLERALAERARAVQELQSEVRRRGALVRDLVERLRARGAGGPVDVGGDAGLRAERDAAVERALDAELARTQAQYRIDELEVALAKVGGASAEPPRGAGPADVAPPEAPATDDAAERALAEARARGDRLAADVEEAARAAELRERDLARLRGELAAARAELEGERRRRTDVTEALADARRVLESLGHGASPVDADDADRGTP